MTLPNERVLELLSERFVVGWHNIEKEDYTGLSHGYSKNQCAVGTTNGAGGRNVQIFMLSPDEVVVHALPGYWHPEDLTRELHFGLAMYELWQSDRPLETKRRLFQRMQLGATRSHPQETFDRSGWQSFDRSFEMQRQRSEPTTARDTVIVRLQQAQDGSDPVATPVAMRPLNVVAHGRIAKQPFVAFEDFNTASFVDYGRPFYDNNLGQSKGRKFTTRLRLEKKRQRDQKREARRRR